ncbi:MAG: hypothetical protein ACK2TX_06760 [Anaerolineales bacterium]|jgi:hypothetical protein
MRFAWLRKHSDNPIAVQQAATHPLALIRKAYNLAFWVFLLPFFTLIDYGTGFLIFTIVIGVRLVLNLVTNNVLQLSPAQYEAYPFRV